MGSCRAATGVQGTQAGKIIGRHKPFALVQGSQFWRKWADRLQHEVQSIETNVWALSALPLLAAGCTPHPAPPCIGWGTLSQHVCASPHAGATLPYPTLLALPLQTL